MDQKFGARYYDAHIGDVLNSRYRLLQELDFCGSSETWLAYDKQLPDPSIFVAVRIRAAGRNWSLVDDLHEQAGHGEPVHPGRAAMQPLLDEFSIRDKFGGPQHSCSVTSAAQLRVYETLDASEEVGFFQPAVARAIIAQLIHAVALLHSRGIVHSSKLRSACIPHWIHPN